MKDLKTWSEKQGENRMKKHQILITMVAFMGLLMLGGQVMAAPSVHLNWGSEVNPGQCDGPLGKLVINVTHKVTNDLDSGLAGWWAYDDYKKHIQVWQVDTNTFCAVVRYQGSFVTNDGPSPMNTDTIDAEIEGTFEGGYRATITGTLNSSPTYYRTKGNIGTFDYGCDIKTDPGDRSTCTLFNWVATYFTSPIFTYEWWGWVYHGGSNGTWVNSSDGNQGDITD